MQVEGLAEDGWAFSIPQLGAGLWSGCAVALPNGTLSWWTLPFPFHVVLAVLSF